MFREQVNLKDFPETRKYPENKKYIIALGDLHASLLKLVWFLKREGIYEVTSENYERICELLDIAADKITAEERENLIQLLNMVSKKYNKNIYAVLLGDDFCDRNGNDADTSEFYKILSLAEISYSIICSNHGLEFILAREKILLKKETTFVESFIATDSGTGSIASMVNLNKYIERGIVKQENIIKDIETYYFPKLKLIDYSFSQDGGLILYKHSTVGLSRFQSLAAAMNVTYKDGTPEELVETFNTMNSTFLNEYLLKNRVYELCFDENGNQGPLAEFVWKRDYDINDLPAVHPNGYRLYYINGHDTDGKLIASHIMQLNNSLSMSSALNSGEYTIACNPHLNHAPENNYIEMIKAKLKEFGIYFDERFVSYLKLQTVYMQASVCSVFDNLSREEILFENVCDFLMKEEKNTSLADKLNFLLALHDIDSIHMNEIKKLFQTVESKKLSTLCLYVMFTHLKIINLFSQFDFDKALEKIIQIYHLCVFNNQFNVNFLYAFLELDQPSQDAIENIMKEIVLNDDVNLTYKTKNIIGMFIEQFKNNNDNKFICELSRIFSKIKELELDNKIKYKLREILITDLTDFKNSRKQLLLPDLQECKKIIDDEVNYYRSSKRKREENTSEAFLSKKPCVTLFKPSSVNLLCEDEELETFEDGLSASVLSI